MIDVPFAYALTVGMVATVNPCGFPMLPAYLSWFVGVDDDSRAGVARVPRALTTGAAVSAGFLAVAGGLGIPIHAGLTELYRLMPWLTMLIGAGLAAMGVALLLGRRPGLPLPRLDRGGRSRGLGSMAAFGASYAVASLGCTLPLFLSVVAGRPNAASGALTVLAYGLGFGLVLTALAVALALARQPLLDRLAAARRSVDRVAGVLLVLAGAYLVWYWVESLASDPGTTTGSGPLPIVDRWSTELAARFGSWGSGLALVLAAVVAGAALLAVAGGRRRGAPGPGPGGPDGEPVAATSR
jgi:cytochrome c biogenesis protein CcdA